MRVAVVSDIHGNIHGLDACLADLQAQGGADVLVAAGDLCMDGPRPEAVIARLLEHEALFVRGNSDRKIAAAKLDEIDPAEAAGIRWQRERLGSERVAWLGDLPFSQTIGEGAQALLVVHANPLSDDEHVWPNADDEQLERLFGHVAQRTVAFGHLHLPYVRMWRERLLVDVASAGQPKDGDERAHYAIFTERHGGWQVKSRRVPFDVDLVVEEIVQEKMPNPGELIETLRRHRYSQIGEVIP